MLAAQTPEKPQTPVTMINGPLVDVTWDAVENGSPITGYIITFLQSDGVNYETELTSCDGSNPTIVTDKSCSVPIATLRASSF